MCDPISAVAVAFTAFTSIQQGRAQAAAAKQEAENNAKIAEYNAKVNEQNADLQRESARDALSRGAFDAATAKQNFKTANATARAKAASSGLLVDQGQYGDLFAEGAAAGELNALTVRNNAEREAYGFQLKANDFTAQARNQRLQGEVGMSNASVAGDIYKSNAMGQATSTIVTGASRLAKNGWKSNPFSDEKPWKPKW